MATNLIYPTAKENFLSGNISLSGTYEGPRGPGGFNPGAYGTPPTYCCLMSSSYIYNAADKYWSTSLAPYMISGSVTGTLVNRTITTGTFDADDIEFTAVSASSYVQSVVIWQSGTAGVADYVIAYFDTGSLGGIGITTNGGNITVAWDSDGIFTL